MIGSKIEMNACKLIDFCKATGGETWTHFLDAELRIYMNPARDYMNVCQKGQDRVILRNGTYRVIADITGDSVDFDGVSDWLESCVDRLIGKADDETIRIYKEKKKRIERLEAELKTAMSTL